MPNKPRNRVLTKVGIERLKKAPQGKRVEYYDRKEPGLAVRVTDKGSKSWVCYFYLGPRHCKVTLGRWPDIGIEKARAAARDVKSNARQGKDPRIEQKRAREHLKASLGRESQYEKVVEKFIDLQKPQYRTWPEIKRVLLTTNRDWLDRPVSTITAGEIQTTLDGFLAAGHPAKARVHHVWLNRFFGWAGREGRGYVQKGLMAEVEVTAERRVRTRRYENEEVRAIWKGAEQLEPTEGAFVKLLLLLAPRKNELAGMRRREFDDPENPTLWTIPFERTKSKKNARRERVYVVPLPRLAQRIIKSIPKTDGTDLLFPGRLEDAPMIPGTNLSAKVRKASGVQDWTYHACRDTIASWLQEQGRSEFERGLMLNHAEHSVTGDYSHGHASALKLEMLEEWADHVAELVQPEGAVVLS